jgi:hypothetical protein
MALFIIQIRLRGLQFMVAIIKIILVFALLLPSLSWAACTGSSPTWASSADRPSVASCVSQAVDGDTINVAAGSATWATAVTWTDKNIAVIGAGKTSTVITSTAGQHIFAVVITDYTKSSFRISGFGFTGTASNSVVDISAMNATQYSYGWRIDHNDFTFTTSGSGDNIVLWGMTWGLIDNNSFSHDTTYKVFLEIRNEISTDTGADVAHAAGTYSLTVPLAPGVYNKGTYVEDNTFTCIGSCAGAAIFDGDMGGMRMVFRHNTVTNGYLYWHQTQTNVLEPGYLEVYANTLVGGAYGTGGLYPMNFRGGTGIVYNNKITGYDASPYIVLNEDRAWSASGMGGSPLLWCDGTHAWDGNLECVDGTARGSGDCSGHGGITGWPCATQVGRGVGTLGALPTVPWYSWKNGADDGCLTGGSCTNTITIAAGVLPDMANYVKGTAHYNGDKDFCSNFSATLSAGTYTGTCGNHSLNYTPAVYPHPLQGVVTNYAPFAITP